MSENLRRYTKAVYNFDHVVRQIPGDAWDTPTPCEGWSIRDVAGHVNAVQRYVQATTAGTPVTMNPFEDPGRHLGDDPPATWAATRDELLATFDHPGVLQREVESFWGPMSVDRMLGAAVGDITIHSWDVATALGLEFEIPGELVDHTLAVVGPALEGMRASGVLGPEVEVGNEASAQDRLLGQAGRDPR